MIRYTGQWITRLPEEQLEVTLLDYFADGCKSFFARPYRPTMDANIREIPINVPIISSL